MRTPTSGVCGVGDATNIFTCTAGVLWRKGDSMATLWVREHPDPCFSGSLTSRKVLIYYAQVCFRWLLFTDNKEKDVADYFLQITKKRILQMQGKKWLNWLYSVLGRFSTEFRKLLQRCALNICCLNLGWGNFSKSKLQSSLDIMLAWFPMGKPICGPGSCVPPLACQFSEPELSYICHRHSDWFPVGYIIKTQHNTNHSLILSLFQL